MKRHNILNVKSHYKAIRESYRKWAKVKNDEEIGHRKDVRVTRTTQNKLKQ